MKILGVIPARYNSSRMPGKPLADISGRPMIWWVYQQVIKSDCLSDVVVATEDASIYKECQRLNMNVVMTGAHDTPTSRLYEVSTKQNADLYLMVMGDEPLIDVRCFSCIVPNGEIAPQYVSALTNIMVNPAEVIDFSNQKVVVNAARNALMISRSPIPYPKGTLDFQYEKVTGVQLFSKGALDFFGHAPKSALERAEENDLIRFIENGISVKMVVSPYKTISVDTPKDLEEVRAIMEERIAQWNG